jgi:hypothetical protein
VIIADGEAIMAVAGEVEQGGTDTPDIEDEETPGKTV